MSGTLSKFAIKKAATWLTAVAPGAGDRYPLKSTTLQHRSNLVEDDTITGEATRSPPEEGSTEVSGALVLTGDYRQNLLLAALLMGTAGAPALVETGVYKHVLPFTADVEGLFATASVDYGGKDVHQFASVKPNRRVIISERGGYLEETYDMLGGGVDKTVSSAAWTFALDPRNGGAKRILHSQAVVRVNENAGGALAGGDQVYPTRIEIEVNRNLSLEYAQGTDPTEPQPDGFASVVVSLRFAEMTAGLLSLFRDSYDDGTLLKSDIVYTHRDLLGATEKRERAFYLPKLRVIECPMEIPGPGRLPAVVRMSAHVATSLPTGFPTGYTQELVEEWQNEISTDPLA